MNDAAKLEALWSLCEKFVREQEIRSRETVFQTDRVIENAYEFIAATCEIVGYFKDDDEGEQIDGW
jgi:hypothetical protein